MYCSDHAKDLRGRYGNISPSSIGSIQRSLLNLEQQGGNRFFGEPALNVADFLKTDASRSGMINILTADRLMQSPKIYATLLLWLLSELFETFPVTVGSPATKFVFFFDEAHLLFQDAPKVLEERIVQVVRLIRQKESGCILLPKTRLICLNRSWGNWETGCTMPSGLSLRKTRKM